MTNILRGLVSPEWRLRAHRLSRLRWITKYRLMRRFRADVELRHKLAYVLFDPELESFSFELANEPEVIAGLAAALDRPLDELAGYAAETRGDPELNNLLSRHVRWRVHVKRRPPLGNRLAWYVIVRALKPKVVVETGIYLGLGSLVLLRALARNRQEGSPGELLSFDTSLNAGSIVREQARGDWRRFVGSTHDLLLPALEQRRVGLLVQDTPHTEKNQRFEFEAALSRAAPHMLLVDCSGGRAHTLEAISSEHEGSFHRVPFRSRGHIYPGGEMGFAVFTDTREDQERSGA
jgi:Methyltransferase domain